MDEIAICGVSGRFPSCKNIDEFKEALLNGCDLINHDHKRWNHRFLKTPSSLGIIDDLDKFDASFFGVNPKQAEMLTSKSRQMIEVAFECISDAGFNPEEFRGTNTGVFLAIAETTGFGYMRRAPAMVPNYVSYYLDLKGPSVAMDAGCSSSGAALLQAMESILLGSCESALVCALQLQIHPACSIEYNEFGILSSSGSCKTFDDDRCGYVKSEAVVCMLLQRTDKARRIYGTIAGIGSNTDGFKEEGLTNPSSISQMNLFQYIYDKYKLNPDDVEYVEAHGTATIVGDIKECDSISSFFVRPSRSHPLKIGSVKTNIGHTEGAAGLVSLAKLLITINTGIIPAHIHYENAPLDIPSIEAGHLEIVTRNTTFNGGLVAFDTFGIGGTNVHAVIRPYSINPNVSLSIKTKTRLILFSGRTREHTEQALDKIEAAKKDLSFLTLIDGLAAKKQIENYPYRGCRITNTNIKKVTSYSSNRPICFSYSGMGSQWPKMGRDLMGFKVFRASITKCAAALKPHGLDLLEIITNADAEMLTNPEVCFPAIISISVGITDILYALGIKPDLIIGHSLGEIGCGYADGSFTAEEAVRVAHARGLATKSTDLIPGAMAAIGLTLEELEAILPDDIYIAAHNYERNITISGPKAAVEQFVMQLITKGIFARIVNTAGIAFHSKYIHDVGPSLMKLFREIISSPRKRSEKWLPSASIPAANVFFNKFNSADYQHLNFMSRVNFKQVLDKVPSNAILIEVAPTGLFQAIFRRALSERVMKVQLISKHFENNYESFLQAIGNIYISTNIPIDLSTINEQKSLPVDGKTRFLSPLIQWDHASSWDDQHYIHNKHNKRFEFHLSNFEDKYLWDHLVNGKSVFPCSGLLFMVWAAKANKVERQLENCPVIIRNMKILKTIDLIDDKIEFVVSIFQSNEFEITNDDAIVAKGSIALLNAPFVRYPAKNDHKISNPNMLNTIDILDEFHLRGLDCTLSFTSIVSLSTCGQYGIIKWTQNWIKFMESIIQSVEFHQDISLKKIEYISEVRIDPNEQNVAIKSQNPLLKYLYHLPSRTATCGGVQITKITFGNEEHQPEQLNPFMPYYDFIPNEFNYQGQYERHLDFSLSMALQIAIENNVNSRVTQIVEFDNPTDGNKLKEKIYSLVHPRYFKNIKCCTLADMETSENGTNLLIIQSSSASVCLSNIVEYLNKFTFVFCKINQKETIKRLRGTIVFSCCKDNDYFLLLKKPIDVPEKYSIIETSNDDLQWINRLQEQLKANDGTTIYLISYKLTCGLIGLFNCLQYELESCNVKVFMFDGSFSKFPLNFNVKDNETVNQLKKGLTINVYIRGTWFTYRMVPPSVAADRINYKNVVRNCQLKIGRDGAKWIETESYSKMLIDVKYAALSQWDSEHFQNNGKIQAPIEFSGRTEEGEAVVGISTDGHCLRTAVFSNLYWKLPSNSDISLEEFATIPLAYTVAYIATNVKTTLSVDTKIFINGLDNTSLATAFFALQFDAQVFMQASKDPGINKIIEDLLPQSPGLTLLSNHDDIIKEILERTNGTGVNLIFSTEEQSLNLNHSEILANNSLVITVHRNHSQIENYTLNSFTLKGCQIHRINLNALLDLDEKTLAQMQMTIQNYLNANELKPFPYVAKSAADLKSIMEYLESKPNWKMVVNVDFNSINTALIERRIYFNSQKSYVIVGGLGGVAIELIKWLVKKGATILVLNSNDTTLTTYQMYLLNKLNQNGVKISINSFDATTVKGAKQLLKAAISLAPIGGIFNLAMNLNSQLFIGTSPNHFHNSIAPQLHISQHLHKLSQMLCGHSLDYFVVFSALAALGGEAVSSYSYACSAIEMLCKERESQGLPALAVQWGWIGDVGYIKKIRLKENQLDNLQNIFSCLETLEKFMLRNQFVTGSVVYKSVNSNLDGNSNSRRSGVLDSIAVVKQGRFSLNLDSRGGIVNSGVRGWFFNMVSIKGVCTSLRGGG